MDNDTPHETVPMNDIDHDHLRAWLLHRLTDADAIAAFEQRMLEDDEFGMRVRALENDLIDDYARGVLDANDQRDVARWLLATPADRARLRAAVALAAAIGSAPRARRWRLPWSATRALPPRGSMQARPRHNLLVAVGAVVSLVVAVVIYQSHRSPQPVADDLTNAPTITLLASEARGADAPASASVSLPRAARNVRLQVEVTGAEPAMHYLVEIAKAGRTVFVARDLVAKTIGPYRFVEMTPDAASVDGDAQVTVTAEGLVVPSQTWALRTRRN